MEYRNFGRTGLRVSPLCLGCMNFGGKTDEAESIKTIHHALDQGVNIVDTANVYSRGASEEVTGKAIKQNGKRGRIVLATKVHGRMDDDDPNAAGNSRRHVMAQCELSLKRLQTDYIDLYQIHRPQSSIPFDETLRALDDLVRQGKIRYIGVSTFAAWQVVEALWMAKELGLNRVVSEQPPYHLLDRRIERELLPMCRTYGVATLPWSPLAGGFFSGKYRRGQARPEGSRWEKSGNLHFCDAAFDVLETVEALAKEKDCSVSQFAIAWVMQQPGSTSVIIGPRNVEQSEDNLGAMDVTVTEDDRKRIDAVAPPAQMIVPYYYADFGPHEHRW